MTPEKFNEKWKDYLEEGHYGLDIDIPELTEYLDKKVFPFVITFAGFKYSQIKSKFHTARFYAQIDDTKDEAEKYWFYHICNEVEKEINKYLWLESIVFNRHADRIIREEKEKENEN